MIPMSVQMILAIQILDVITLQLNMMTITLVLMMIVALDMALVIPQYLVMITMLVLKTGVITILDVNMIQ